MADRHLLKFSSQAIWRPIFKRMVLLSISTLKSLPATSECIFVIVPYP